MTSWVLWQECIGRSASYKHPLPCLEREEPEKEGNAGLLPEMIASLGCGGYLVLVTETTSIPL